MIRSHFVSAIALAAFLAAPAFAQTTTSSTNTGTASDQHSGAMTSSTQKAATPRNKASTAQRAAADQGRTPLCSELGNNAGKLADKSTGQASANSASAVHMDCLPDGSPTTATTGTSTANSTIGTTSGNTTDVTNSARHGAIAGSTTGTANTTNVTPNAGVNANPASNSTNTTSNLNQGK